MKNTFTLHTDGGSRGNPGPSGIGYVITDQTEKEIASGSEYIGSKTNNEAEYIALIKGLEQALKLDIKTLNIVADSELMIKQLNKQYKVKQDHLKLLFEQVVVLASKFEQISYSHVKREFNTKADALVNLALDKKH